MDKEKLEQSFEDAVINFDFEKVHIWMTLSGWTWGNFEKVPTISLMEKTCRRLFNNCLKETKDEEKEWFSGGFKVYCDFVNNWVSIEFIMESAEGYCE